MSNGRRIELKRTWQFTLHAPSVCMALSPASGQALVVAEDCTACLLDKTGGADNPMTLPGKVAHVCASSDGRVFAVATEDGKVTAIAPDGKPLWSVAAGAGVTDIDLGLSGRRLAVMRPPYGVALLSPGRREKQYKCRHKCASIALAESPVSGIVVASELGDVSFLDVQGATGWHYSAGARSGPMRLSHAVGVITLPVYEEGVRTFTLTGQVTGSFELGQSVAVASAAAQGGVAVLAALTDTGSIMLMDMDGVVLWRHQFQAAVTDFDMTHDASLIVAAVGERRIVGLELEVQDAAQAAVAKEAVRVPVGRGTQAKEQPEPAVTQESPWAVEEEAPAGEVEPVRTPGGPRPKSASLLAEVQMPGGTLPEDRERLAVSAGGDFVLVALPGGEALAVNRAGEVIAEGRLEPPVRVGKKRSSVRLAAWNSTTLMGFEFGSAQKWQLPLGAVPVRHLDCSGALDLVCLVEEEDNLVVLRRDGSQVGRCSVRPSAVDLLMAPSNGTILTRDAQGRLRFFDGRAKPRRKLKIKGTESFDHVVLEDGFCAFGGSEGRVFVQDMLGKMRWASKVVDSVARLDSLEDALAVYGDGGKCLVLNPSGEMLVEFDPPPGQCALRTPADGDPILLHARRNVLTAFGGHHSKLNVLWRFACEAEIEFFEADCDGSLVVIAAGDRLYLVEGPPE